MKISTVVRAAIATCALAFSAHASSAVLQVNSSGILTGATGVTVEGKLYDVTFVDGTCVSLFSGCDAASDFAFQSVQSARAAATALLNEVFIDGPKGSFNSSPHMIAGCGAMTSCGSFVPFISVQDLVGSSLALNNSSNSGDIDWVGAFGNSIFRDLRESEYYNYAKFQIAASEVPEPSSLALMGLAMAGVAFSRRRKS